MLSVNDFTYTLDSLCGEGTQFRLKKVAPLHETLEEVDKKSGEIITKKGKVIGCKYTVVDSDNGVKFAVKIEGDIVPIIENTEVRKAPKDKPILVTFEGTTASFYGDNLWACNLSVSAEKINIVSVTVNSMNSAKTLKLQAET
jgi:hypothetical protein